MKLPSVSFPAQTRTISCGLAIHVANQARHCATALELEHSAAQTTLDLVKLSEAIADAARAARATDAMCALLNNMKRALDGEEYEATHEAVREARDMRLRLEAMRRIVPEFERPDLGEFRSALDAA